MEILNAILPYILSGGVVALLTFLITAKQIRREAVLKNDSAAIGNTDSSVKVLQEVVKELRTESASRKEEREQYASMLEQERFKCTDLIEENTAVKMFMCVHLGCSLRQPMSGQGDAWYQSHKGDPSLGADFLPINQLLRKYGAKAKAEVE